MTTQQIHDVKSTWHIVAQLDPVTVGNLFYTRLFEISPSLKHMFANPMPEQSKKLLSMIGYVINKLDKLEDIIDEVEKLAIRHTKYGVQNDHYTIVGTALLWTLSQGLGEHWTDEVKEAWIACYTILSNAMIAAAEQSCTMA